MASCQEDKKIRAVSRGECPTKSAEVEEPKLVLGAVEIPEVDAWADQFNPEQEQFIEEEKESKRRNSKKERKRERKRLQARRQRKKKHRHSKLERRLRRADLVRDIDQ